MYSVEKQSKIDFIYEQLANKKWTLGCQFFLKNDEYKRKKIIISSQPNGSSSLYIENSIIKNPKYQTSDIRTGYFLYMNICSNGVIEKIQNYKTNEYLILEEIVTIGHPLMINDIMSKIQEGFLNIKMEELIKYWINFNNPIERQTDDCINNIYNLLKNSNETNKK